MICFFHTWEIISKYHYTDTSHGRNWPMTSYHLRCIKCGKIKEKELFGK